MPFSHFVAKLVIGGGPPPSEVFRRLIKRSLNDPKHIAWFKGILGDDQFERAGNSICILLWMPGDGAPIEAVIARILDGFELGLPDEEDQRYYAAWPNLTNWWPLGGFRGTKERPDIALTRFGSLNEIPGHQWKTQNGAGQVFCGMAAVAGWAFPESFDTLGWVQELAVASV